MQCVAVQFIASAMHLLNTVATPKKKTRFAVTTSCVQTESAPNWLIYKTKFFSTSNPSANIWCVRASKPEEHGSFYQNKYICHQTLGVVWEMFGDIRYRYASVRVAVILVPGIFSAINFSDLMVSWPPTEQPKTSTWLVQGFKSKRASKSRWVGRNSGGFRSKA